MTDLEGRGAHPPAVRPARQTAELPPGYPQEYQRLVTLRDGRSVLIRPILPGDAPALAEAIESADADTIRRRYLGRHLHVTPELLDYLTTVDYASRFALVAVEPASQRGVAIARYEPAEQDGTAEVAIAVAPAWRDVGLAAFRPTILLAVPGCSRRSLPRPASRPKPRATGAFRCHGGHGDRLEPERTPGGPAAAAAARGVRPLVYARLRAALGGQVALAISCGAPLNQELGHFLRGAGITVMEGWGLTETTGPVTMNRPAVQQIGSVGLPLPGCAVRIAPDGEVEAPGTDRIPGLLARPAGHHPGARRPVAAQRRPRPTGRRRVLTSPAGRRT